MRRTDHIPPTSAARRSPPREATTEALCEDGELPSLAENQVFQLRKLDDAAAAAEMEPAAALVRFRIAASV
jgi:hypothetical protein